MLNKIVFLCVNPWESFQPPAVQGLIKSYYHQICEQTYLQEESAYCREQISLYGEMKQNQNEELFEKCRAKIQILYVRSHQKEMLQNVFEKADLVVVGLPYSKKECDKIFLKLLPWKEKILFLWDKQFFEENFLERMKREYRLLDKQFLEAKKLPSFVTEAVNS